MKKRQREEAAILTDERMQKALIVASEVYNVNPMEKRRMKLHTYSRYAIFTYFHKDYNARRLSFFFDLTEYVVSNGRKRHSEYMETDKEYRELYTEFVLKMESYG